jgi:integrase
MPVYRKKGRGREAWRVKVWAQGKGHERLVHGTKAEAEAFEARWRVELERGAPASSPRTAPTFSAFCQTQYGPHAALHLKASTWKVRRYQLATLAAHFGAMKLSAITTAEIERYKAARRAAGVRPITVNNELAVLQAVLTFAADVKVPLGEVKMKALPVVGRGRVTFWTEEQIAALFAAVEEVSPELLPIVVFLVNTGCRKGEALAAEHTWIDLRAGLIRIPVNEEWQPKDNEPREIPISDALRPWLERALRGRGPWLFPSSARSPEGRPLCTRFACWPKKQFDRARIAAGLKGGPHTLRHTFASHFLKAVPDLFLLAKVLGHSYERTTKLYAHLLPDHLARARNAVSIGPSATPAGTEAKRRWGT